MDFQAVFLAPMTWNGATGPQNIHKGLLKGVPINFEVSSSISQPWPDRECRSSHLICRDERPGNEMGNTVVLPGPSFGVVDAVQEFSCMMQA